MRHQGRAYGRAARSRRWSGAFWKAIVMGRSDDDRAFGNRRVKLLGQPRRFDRDFHVDFQRSVSERSGGWLGVGRRDRIRSSRISSDAVALDRTATARFETACVLSAVCRRASMSSSV